MSTLLSGALVMACFVLALHFLRFWKATRDRFFLLFAVAFLLHGAQWTYTGVFGPDNEYLPFAYCLRLAAYVLIVLAIMEKNRSRSDVPD